MTDNSHYCVYHGYVATCNEDMSVPFSSRVVAVIDDPNNDNLHTMLHRANTQPELLAALEGVFEKHAKPCFQGDPYTLEPEWETARAAIAKAKP